MAQTTYNASVAYNAPIRYDGVTAAVAAQPSIGFDAPRKRKPEPPKPAPPVELVGTVRGVSVSVATITGVVDTSRAQREDLFLLDLI